MKTSVIVAASLATVFTAGVGYAAYFDYKRRNDVEFRKKLLRQRREYERSKRAQVQQEEESLDKTIVCELQKVRLQALPSSVELREEFFMNAVAEGETLCTSADRNKHLEAAICFFKAMRVYPNPKDLMTIYERTVPKPVYDMLERVIKIDAASGETGGLSLD